MDPLALSKVQRGTNGKATGLSHELRVRLCCSASVLNVEESLKHNKSLGETE